MFEINFNISTPIYKQIKQNIKHAISQGIYNADEKLPSIQQMAKMTKISPKTIAKAYYELEIEEVVYTKRGLGTFASSKLTNTESNFTESLVKDKIIEIIDIYRNYNIDLKELEKLFKKIIKEKR